jgi:hypothetical protein
LSDPNRALWQAALEEERQLRAAAEAEADGFGDKLIELVSGLVHADPALPLMLRARLAEIADNLGVHRGRSRWAALPFPNPQGEKS